jgi:hypothetical protein
MVGNFMELKTIHIYFYDDDDRDEAPSPDWGILSLILRYLRCKVTLSMPNEDYVYDAVGEEFQGFTRAIHGHPMISEFRSEMEFTFANFGPLCSTLVTLPSLGRVTLALVDPETDDERVLGNLEPVTELLQAPALRFVEFDDFYFTNALCHATANALEKESPVTDITFGGECTFPDGGRAIIMNALKTNATVTDVTFLGDYDEPFFNSLATVLLSNSTLQNVTIQASTRVRARWFSSIFLSLRRNTTLKSLTLGIYNELGDDLPAAITSGLANNSTLKKLNLHNIVPSGDDGAASARNALSFLRTNSTLKSLALSFLHTQQEFYVSAFRLETVKMLEENRFLKSLTITASRDNIRFEELLALISALQLNTTLKILSLQHFFSANVNNIYLSDDKANQLVSILRKNYGLERLVPVIFGTDRRTVKAILKLNRAGRRYLIEDGSSISKGVEVLSAVNDDINCVFLHLLENPGLCVRKEPSRPKRRREVGDRV